MSFGLTEKMVSPAVEGSKRESAAGFRSDGKGDGTFGDLFEKVGRMTAESLEDGREMSAGPFKGGTTKESRLQEEMGAFFDGRDLKKSTQGVIDLTGGDFLGDGKGLKKKKTLDEFLFPGGMDSEPVVNSAGQGIMFSKGAFRPERGDNPALTKMAGGSPELLAHKLREIAVGKGAEEFESDDQGILLIAESLKELGLGDDRIKDFLSRGEKEGEGLSLSRIISLTEEMDLVPEAGGEGKETLEMSALPFMESLLTLLGLESGEVKNVLQEAGLSNGEIDLNKLATSLRGLPGEIGRGEPLQPGGVQADQAGKLMAGLGLGMNGKAPLTVNELASRLETVAAGTGNRASGGGPLENRSGMLAAHIRKSGSDRSVAPATNPGHAMGETKKEGAPFSLEGNPAAAGRAGASVGETVKPALAASLTGGGEFSEQPALKSSAVAGTGSFGEAGDGDRFMTGSVGGHDMHGKEISASPRGQERVLPSYVADQVGRQIHRAVQNGDSEIRFQVNPSALGKIRMSLERTREGLKVVIVAEQNATRDLLMAGSHDLKALLSEQGVKVDRIDVDVSGGFDQSLAGTKQDSGDSRGRRGSSGGRQPGGGQVEEVTGDSPVKGSGRGNGILDLVA